MDFSSRKFAFADGAPPVVIGEIGVNHNGDPALARRLVDVAAEAGVNVVKLQVFKSENEISRFAQLAPYQKVTASVATNQLDLCKTLELSHSAIEDLKRYCGERKIGFFCSVFDSDSLRFLVDDLKIAAIKVASGEITNLPFLEEIGRRKLGVILSTGGSTLAEVAEAVSVLTTSGCPELVLLHCVSSYPALPSELEFERDTNVEEGVSASCWIFRSYRRHRGCDCGHVARRCGYRKAFHPGPGPARARSSRLDRAERAQAVRDAVLNLRMRASATASSVRRLRRLRTCR